MHQTHSRISFACTRKTFKLCMRSQDKSRKKNLILRLSHMLAAISSPIDCRLADEQSGGPTSPDKRSPANPGRFGWRARTEFSSNLKSN
jgi:hypothetical protein